jgi:hypothetical protein
MNKSFLRVFFVLVALFATLGTIGCGGTFSTRGAPTPVNADANSAALALETAKMLAANASSMSCDRSPYSGNRLNGFGGESTCERVRHVEAGGLVYPGGKVELGRAVEFVARTSSGDPAEIARLKRRYLP